MIDWTKPQNWLIFAVMLLVIGFVLNQVGSRSGQAKRALASSGLVAS